MRFVVEWQTDSGAAPRGGSSPHHELSGDGQEGPKGLNHGGSSRRRRRGPALMSSPSMGLGDADPWRQVLQSAVPCTMLSLAPRGASSARSAAPALLRRADTCSPRTRQKRTSGSCLGPATTRPAALADPITETADLTGIARQSSRERRSNHEMRLVGRSCAVRMEVRDPNQATIQCRQVEVLLWAGDRYIEDARTRSKR